MTIRQKIMRLLYPAIMRLTKTSKKGRRLINKHNVVPVKSFYSLKAKANSGKELSFDQWRGKKVLIVNTASDCGFTSQYKELQQLHELFEGGLVVLAFPSNDFREQEKRRDDEIAQFCQLHYGVTFPLMKKSVVKKSKAQDPVYQWLTDAACNGWNNHQPDWNFSKFLINEQGTLTHYFGPAISPLSAEVLEAAKELGKEQQVMI